MKLTQVLLLSVLGLAAAHRKRRKKSGYEVWASDQSNSAPGQASLGVKGSFLWIFDSDDISRQLKGKGDAQPLSCDCHHTVGPCDLLKVFPQDLAEYNQGGPTGKLLGELPGFGRLHGVIQDPQSRYVNANIFAPSGGYVGVIDTTTKEAIGLFRVTEFTSGRSVHMSFWNSDGSAILVDNLNGKAIERINVSRDSSGTITALTFDKSASLGLGKAQEVVSEATFFYGSNAFGHPLLGGIEGDYTLADLGDLTPSGVCKENGCTGIDGDKGGRPNNVPICPLVSLNDNLYVTFGGGGLFVADARSTPMKIVAEYGNNVVYGAGCGGVEVDGKMFINSGVSASGAGATQSMFAVWAFDDNAFYSQPDPPLENTPMPDIVFEDSGNTNTGGNMKEGSLEADMSGQLPGTTTRRDSHGMDSTVDGQYIHVVDRIQNTMEVFDTSSYDHVSTYDLTSKNGMPDSATFPGGCAARSISDGGDMFPLNDPAPDLFEHTPDGKFMMIALRGPAPVSVNHSAQGSCPGVGVVELYGNGKYGKLVDVLRTTNVVPDQFETVNVPGGAPYSGTERSDVHGAIVIPKN